MPTGPYDITNSSYYNLYGAPGVHQYSPWKYNQSGQPLWNKDVYSQAKNAGYFQNPTGSIWGSGYGGGSNVVSPINTGANNTFQYPTSQELWNSVYNLDPFKQQRGLLTQMGVPTGALQQQRDILGQQAGVLGQMATPQAFQQAIQPQIGSIMNSLRGSGMQSSSLSDRTIANTLGSLWQQNQGNVLSGLQGLQSGWQNLYGQQMGNLTNQLTGWQNMAGQMPSYMNMWQQPYSTVLGML